MRWLLAATGVAVPAGVAWTGFSAADEPQPRAVAQQTAVSNDGSPKKFDAIVTAWASEELKPGSSEPRPFSAPKADPLVRPAAHAAPADRYQLPTGAAQPALVGDRYGAPAPIAPEPIKPLPIKPLPIGTTSPAPLPRLTPAGSNVQELAPPKIAPLAALPPLTPEGSNAQAPASNELSIRPEATAELPTNNPLRPQPNNGQGAAAAARAKDAFAAPQPATAQPLKMEISAPPQVADVPAQPIRMATNEIEMLPTSSLVEEPRELAPMGEPNPLRMSAPTPISPAPIAVAPITAAPITPAAIPPVQPAFTPPATPRPQSPVPSPQPAMAEGHPGDRSLEGAQRPAIIIEKLPPAAAQVGAVCKFITRVRNVGEQPAEEVLLIDQVPAGSRLVNTSPTAEQQNGELVWQLGTLASGEAREVEIEVAPTAEGNLGSVARVSFTTQASSRVRATQPQLKIVATAGSEVLVGRQHRVSIELTNAGSGDATNVMILENVPEQLKHEAGPALEFEIGTLRAGETRKLDLVLTAEQAGRVQNEIIARADGELEARQVVEFNVIAPALNVAIDGPAKRYLERPATYTVSINNPGTAPARDVRLVTKLPKGLKFVRANNMGEYDPSTHAVYWSLAELPQGERGAVELVAMPIEAGEQPLKVQGVAREGLKVEQIQPLIVEGIAAIRFEVRDLADPIEVGGETTYEIRVTNQGSKSATDVKVLAKAPAGMRLVAAEGETQHRVAGDSLEFAPLEQLPPHGEATYRVKVEGATPGDHRMTVFVTTADMPQPIREEESTRVFGDE